MPYARTRSRRSNTAGRAGRWMDLRYAGNCWVCGDAVPAGGRGFYDPADRTVTCTKIDCADVAGLTKQEWHGSPVSGGFITVLSPIRVGGERRQPAWKERYGRCEDAPCCGCCP